MDNIKRAQKPHFLGKEAFFSILLPRIFISFAHCAFLASSLALDIKEKLIALNVQIILGFESSQKGQKLPELESF